MPRLGAMMDVAPLSDVMEVSAHTLIVSFCLSCLINNFFCRLWVKIPLSAPSMLAVHSLLFRWRTASRYFYCMLRYHFHLTVLICIFFFSCSLSLPVPPLSTRLVSPVAHRSHLKFPVTTLMQDFLALCLRLSVPLIDPIWLLLELWSLVAEEWRMARTSPFWRNWQTRWAVLWVPLVPLVRIFYIFDVGDLEN